MNLPDKHPDSRPKIKKTLRATSFFIFSIISLNALSQDTLRTYYDEDSLHVKEIVLKINGKAEGPVRLYDPDSRLILIGHIQNDQKNGNFYDLNPRTGDTLRVVRYEDNQRQGKSQSFYPGGLVSQESNFIDNQLEGLVVSYFEDGTVSHRIPFENNKPNGISESYYPNGQLKSKVEFVMGQPQGIKEEYAKNGQLILKTYYKSGMPDGTETWYFPDGTLRSSREYDNGELNGTYLSYYPDGKLRNKGVYKKGLPEGKIEEFYPNGSPRMRAKYKKGIPVQPTVYYHPNGQTKSQVFFGSQGSKIREETFFEDGTPHAVTPFANGQMHGEVKIYRKNGKILEISNYIYGKLDGRREFYDENGILSKTEIWKNGNKIDK